MTPSTVAAEASEFPKDSFKGSARKSSAKSTASGFEEFTFESGVKRLLSHLVVGRLNHLKSNAPPRCTCHQRGHHQIDGRVAQDRKTERDERIQRPAVGLLPGQLPSPVSSIGLGSNHAAPALAVRGPADQANCPTPSACQRSPSAPAAATAIPNKVSSLRDSCPAWLYFDIHQAESKTFRQTISRTGHRPFRKAQQLFGGGSRMNLRFRSCSNSASWVRSFRWNQSAECTFSFGHIFGCACFRFAP